MPELKNNFTGGKMNKDLDERLVPNGQYRDAWNVQVSTTDESEIGALQNLLGNSEITNSIIPGDAVCVGSIADEKNNNIYFLIAATGVSKIIRWNTVEEQLIPVFVDIGSSVLQYDKKRLITGINIIDDMLFWTDNFTEPKRINIPRSIEGTNPSGLTNTLLVVPERNITTTTPNPAGGTGFLVQESNITVIKKGPKVPPILRLENRGSTSIKLYCGQPYDSDPFSVANVGSEVFINVKNLIDGFYGNVLHDYYSVGDTLYLKAVDKTPLGSDPDLEESWSNGVDRDHDIQLQIVSIGDTSPTGSYQTLITCTLLNKSGNEYSDIYTVTNLSDPELIFEKKFPRFATRWKYSDGEYSSFSPFSQIAFSPGSFSYHPKKGFNLGMVNTLHAAHVEQFIPVDIPDDVVSVDILYREAGSPVIYIVDTISKNDPAIPGQSFNYWNSQYNYNTFTQVAKSDEDTGFKGTYRITSDTISKAIPENQTGRHWDNVPRAALGQEIVANRLVYGNYLQNYNLYSGTDTTIPYRSNFELNIEEYEKEDFQLPRGSYYDSLPSIKSLRTYQVGIVYEDDYGRQTPVLTSESGVIKTNKDVARKQHRLTIKTLNDAPDWATSFKYFIKETSSDYYNLAMDRVFDAEDGNVWLSFPSSDRAKVDEETYLILKKDVHGAFVKERARYKILSVKNEAPDFIKLQASGLDTVAYDVITSGTFSTTGLFSAGANVPVKDSKIFEIDGDRHNELTELIAIFAQKRAEKDLSSGDPLTIGQEEVQISLRIINESGAQYNGRSQWYRVDKIFNSSDSLGFEFTMEKPFEEDIEFSYVLDGGVVAETFDETKIVFRKEKEEHKSWFDGRFFVKIERDLTVDNKVISTPTKNWSKVAQNRLYYLHSGEGKQMSKIGDNFVSQTTSSTYPGPSNMLAHGHYHLYGSSLSVPGTRIRTSLTSGSPYTGADINTGFDSPIEAHFPQCNDVRTTPNNPFQFPPPADNANRVMGILGHYIGLNDYGSGSYPDRSNSYIQKSFWYIDRTYFYRNNSTNSYAPKLPTDESYYTAGLYNNTVDGNPSVVYNAGNSWQWNRRKGMRLDENEKPRKISIAFTQILDADQYDGSVPSASEFDLSLYPEHKNFIEKLKVGTKVKFSDDQTGENNQPVMRTITNVEGPFSILNHGKAYNATPNDPYALRVGWNITFDKHFGNPVYNVKGYNPLYTLKDVAIERDDGTVETCPREECTGGATYPWADQVSVPTAHSSDLDDVGGNVNPTIMQIYEDQYSIGDSEKIVADSPVIWETEPKQETDIDLYYEASGSYPISISNSTTQPVRPGAIVKVSKSNPDYYNNDVDADGNTWLARNNLDTVPGQNAIVQSIDFNLDINLGNTANADDAITLEAGTILDIIFKGTKIEVVVEEDVDSAIYIGNSSVRISSNIHSNLVSLNWFNCYVFGEDIGVESDRIRDDFNAVTIDNGPKVSTTVIEGRYKEERRKHGLIFSGIYNSMSGINNLNQFIIGEGNIKELNPSYGSIQKLHTRDTDLITLCEDKVLKILANKDALFNADGSANLTSSKNVLGQAVPFVGEYGISKNPESFASESYRAYFTDAKRGAVLRLSRDGLTPIHEFGMRNWFADYFNQDEKTMINQGLDKSYVIGSYDTKKKHYNVTFSDLTVSFSEDAKGWVSFKSMASRLKQYDETILNDSMNYPVDFAGVSLNNKYYTFREGKLWLHHVGAIYNNFYGHQFNSSVNLVLNGNPEIVKSFNTLNYEGSSSRIEEITTEVINGVTYNDQEYYNLVARDGWFVNSIVTDKGKSTEQHGMVNEFIEKEGKWFNYIKGEATNINNIDPSETSLQGLGLPSAISVPTSVFGCTDSNAINYDPAATNDDGSCITCVYGCTDASASNYSSFNTCDDGTCTYFACTNPGAINFVSSDPQYTDDGSCQPYIYGCLDINSSNYNANANSWCTNNTSDFNAGNNYTQIAFDGGFLGTGGDETNNCCIVPVPGCTNPLSYTYDPNATVDDGSCMYDKVGCPDPNACDYDPVNAPTGCINDPDGIPSTGDEYYEAGNTDCCTYCAYGCMSNTANNYAGPGNTNGFPPVDTPCDGSPLSDAYGADALCINGQTGINCCCDEPVYVVYGCTDPAAANYDNTATQSDGTCCYAGCGGSSTVGIDGKSTALGSQPDINGYCTTQLSNPNHPNYTTGYNHNGYIESGNANNYIGASYVGFCDPTLDPTGTTLSGVVGEGCGKCVAGLGNDLNGNPICGNMPPGTECGNEYINYDPSVEMDCFGNSYACDQSPIYPTNCVDGKTGPDCCCSDTVDGCNPFIQWPWGFSGASYNGPALGSQGFPFNYGGDQNNNGINPIVNNDDGSCDYPGFCCPNTNACNFAANYIVTPGNPTGLGDLCDISDSNACVYNTCIGCIDPDPGFFAGVLTNGFYGCRGSDKFGLETANLHFYVPSTGDIYTPAAWQGLTSPKPSPAYRVCTKDGTMNSFQADGTDNRDGWNAMDYCIDCDLPNYWGASMQHNPNNTPIGANCTYYGAGCTDGGQYDPMTSAGMAYVNQAALAVAQAYGSGPGTQYTINGTDMVGYQYGSITPGQAAYNYDPLASSDDGSCYPVIEGCAQSGPSNSGHACENGNFYWGMNDSAVYAGLGLPDYDPDVSNPFLNVNTDDGNCCDPTIYGCIDNTANQFTHDLPVGTNINVSNYTSIMYGGMAYAATYPGNGAHKAYLLGVTNDKGQSSGYNQGVGAFNYDFNATGAKQGFWKADLDVVGYIPANNANASTSYGYINNIYTGSDLPAGFDITSSSDISSVAGSGNEDACCYMAGCLDPRAYNYEYNGYGLDSVDGSKGRTHGYDVSLTSPQAQRINYFVGGETDTATCSDCTNAYDVTGTLPSFSIYHRTCADCNGAPATDYFVDAQTGGAITGSTTLGVLSADKVIQYANKDCCCYVAGCPDPAANNYNPNACFNDGTCQYAGI